MRTAVILTSWILTLVWTDLHAQADTSFQRETDAWHAQRVSALKAEDGWLNLAGLHWLNEGVQTFGSDSTQAIVFPPGRIAGMAGRFVRRGDLVMMYASKDSGININGRPAQIDTNLKHPALSTVKGIDRFPADTNWRVNARLITDPYTRNIPITNVLGQSIQTPLAGRLHFILNGRPMVLDALTEGDELFIIFGDETSGLETYAAGRFLYASMPDTEGNTILDFNRAINPPCAFTTYATCPLPPRQNVLSVAVRAGEKDHHY